MADPLPFHVTIVMPVRNEAGFVERCLESVTAQDYPMPQVEVFVVDGMSEDGTRQIVEDLVRRLNLDLDLNLRLIDNPGRIVPSALNTALGVAKGDIVVRVDGHCEIPPDYVRRCVEHIVNDGVDGVGGSVETVGETRTAETIAAAMSSRFGVGDSAFRTESGKTMFVDTIPFPAYTRSVIERAGGYDEELVRCQDDEYNYRLREMGVKLLLAADVRSKYYSRASLGSLWKQYFQYGFYKVRVLQKHPKQMRLRQFVPPMFTLSVIIVLGLWFLVPRCWIGLALVAGSYVVANVGASVLTAAKKGWRHLPLLPIVYAILHLSYGLGFLIGLFRFWNRWGDRVGRVPQFSTDNSEVRIQKPESRDSENDKP
jgi:cellulose synthase/poly-beta-1,6-N-acetylglucosamine synthase-like glycosyltransferase